MGLWSAVKSVFSSDAKPVNDILDKDNGILVRTGGFINDLHYSSQEKARDSAAEYAARAKALDSLLETATEHAKATQSENTQRSLTRRHLAIGIMRVELFLVLLCVVMWKIDKAYAEFVWDVASSSLMFGAFGATVIFFFGTYGISQHIMKPIEGVRKAAKRAVHAK